MTNPSAQFKNNVEIINGGSLNIKDNGSLNVSGGIVLDGSLNLPNIGDLEEYIETISGGLMSLNKIRNNDDNITISDNSMSFVINGNEKFAIDSSNVYIDVSLNLTEINDLENYILDLSNEVTYYSNKVESGNSNFSISDNSMSFVVDGDVAMEITNNGDVSFSGMLYGDGSELTNIQSLKINDNTNDTNYKLTFVDSTGDNQVIYIDNTNGPTYNPNTNILSQYGDFHIDGDISINGDITGYSDLFISRNNGMQQRYGTGAIRVYNNSGTTNTSTELFAIKNNGKVGIGVNDPDTNLDVSGDVSFSGDALINNLLIGDVNNNNNNTGIRNNTLTGDNDYALIQENDGETILNASTGKSIHFKINNSNTDKVSISNSQCLYNIPIRFDNETSDICFTTLTMNTDVSGLTNHILFHGADRLYFLGEATNKNDNVIGLSISSNSGNDGNPDPDLAHLFTHEGHYYSGGNIISNGKIGIGIDEPDEELEVSGNVNIDGSLNIGGNIGIGTSTSSTLEGKLHIYEATGTEASKDTGTIVLEHGDISGTSSITFVSKNSGDDYAAIEYTSHHTSNIGSESGRLTIKCENDNADDIYFQTNDNTNMVIQGLNGHIGIGTEDPGAPLEVSGNIKTSGTDFILWNEGRGGVGTSPYGRALVHTGSNANKADSTLVINFANDFGAGTIIDSNLEVNGDVTIDNSLNIGGNVVVDGSMNLNNITDLENYILDLSGEVTYYSNKVESGNSNFTISDNSMSFVVDGTTVMEISNNGDVFIDNSLNISNRFTFMKSSSNWPITKISTHHESLTRWYISPYDDSKTLYTYLNGKLIIKETEGSTAERVGSSNDGALIITHGDLNGNSGILFPSAGENNNYGAINYSEGTDSSGELSFTCANDTGNPDDIITFKTGWSGSPDYSPIERMRITGGGNVGIGTSSPSKKLEVDGDVSFTGTLYHTGNIDIDTGNITGYNSNFFIKRDTGPRISFGTSAIRLQDTSNTDVLTIKNNRTVGINNDNPSKELDISGDINFTGDLYQNGSLLLAGGGWSAGTGSNSNDIYSSNSGNVGIGTSSPSEKLEVVGDVSFSGDALIDNLLIGDVNNNANNRGIRNNTNTGNGDYALLQANDGSTFLNASSGETIHFRINNHTYMKLDSDGTDGTLYMEDCNMCFGSNTAICPIHIKQSANTETNHNGALNTYFDDSPEGGAFNYTIYGDLGSANANSDTYGSSNSADSNDLDDARNIFHKEKFSNNTYYGGLSIYTEGAIYTKTMFVTASDSRIKENIRDICSNEALNLLRQIKPRKYQYRDKLTRGDQDIYGFIAQEVAEVFPSAVSKSSSIIPNILEFAILDKDKMKITFNSNIDISLNLVDESGNEFAELEICRLSNYNQYNNTNNIKIYTADASNNIFSFTSDDDLDNIKLCTISDVSGNYIKDSSGNIINNFIYVVGQRVDDFHSLTKAAIWSISTAALHEVDRIQQTHTTQLQEYQTTINNQQTTIDNQQTTINDLQSRLTNMESLVESMLSRLSAIENA